jgi:uncharacterized delta-60 repeat protein
MTFLNSTKPLYPLVAATLGCLLYPVQHKAKAQPGTLDLRFTAGVGLQGQEGKISCAVAQPDGKVVLGGVFRTIGNVPRDRLARLNADGTLDVGFSPGWGIRPRWASVSAIAVQRDAKILVGGSFTNFQGLPHSGLVRVDANGTLEPSFRASLPPNLRSESIHIFSVQDDGKILVGSDHSAGGPPDAYRRIARLNPDGTMDAGFHLVHRFMKTFTE